MGHFDVVVDTKSPHPVKIVHPTLGERLFSFEMFEAFVENLPIPIPSQQFGLKMKDQDLLMSMDQFAHFRLNCNNLLIAMQQVNSMNMKLKHNHG